MAIKIGIPRGLAYFYYYPLWEKFFRALGAEPVLSSPTSRPIFNRGVVLASDETCLPVKVFYGHVEELKERQVDYIFMPRLVSMEKGTYMCPKLLGFPEVVTAMLPDLPPVLSSNFNLRRDEGELDKALADLGKQLGFSRTSIKDASLKAKAAQKRFEQLLHKGQEFELALRGRSTERPNTAKGIKIGVLGHAYLLYDSFASIDIRGKLKAQGVEIITPEGITPGEIDANLADLPKRMFWSHSKRILGAGYNLVKQPEIDGLIHLTCFGCGPDSMVGDMIERVCRREGKPFMMLTLDEHTGEAGMITRLEAYIDMLRRRVELEDNLSAHG